MKSRLLLLLLLAAPLAEAREEKIQEKKIPANNFKEKDVQDKKILEGKVIAGNAVVTGIFVINKRTGLEVKTDASGSFRLESNVGDRVIIYGESIEIREFVLSEASFAQKPYVLEAEPKITELREVVINHINPESLGLVPKGQRIVTERERAYMRNSGGSGLEYLANAIMGRLWIYRMATETMKKEDLANEIDALVKDSEFEQYGIPREMARGFIFYVVEDKRVAGIMNTNSAEIKLLLIELGKEYMKLKEE